MAKKEFTKELEPIKVQISKAESAAFGLQIKTAENLTVAVDILGKIKTVGRMIKAKKESITKPLNEALRNARAIFAPLEEQWANAENVVKMKMVAYQDIQTFKAKKKVELIEKKVEVGKINPEMAKEELKEIVPPTTVKAGDSGVQFRTIKEITVEDETKLPREYLIPDMVKIRKVANAGVDIPGVKVISKQTVAGTRK